MHFNVNLACDEVNMETCDVNRKKYRPRWAFSFYLMLILMVNVLYRANHLFKHSDTVMTPSQYLYVNVQDKVQGRLI